jgi:hypothetical protein
VTGEVETGVAVDRAGGRVGNIVGGDDGEVIVSRLGAWNWRGGEKVL